MRPQIAIVALGLLLGFNGLYAQRHKWSGLL